MLIQKQVAAFLLLLFQVFFSVNAAETLKRTFTINSEPIPSDEPFLQSESSENEIKYLPTWDSIDSRPLPQWYDDGKVGIFIHWGVFSVPSFNSEWFWTRWVNSDAAVVAFMKDNYPPGFTYQDFAPQFTTEFFDPNYWADTFSKAGAKYIVLTSKHHEGFTLWPSKYSFSWNAKDVGPKRDLVGQLAEAVRNRTDIKFGLYHSMFEWYNPLWLSDKASGFVQNEMVVNKVIPELKELVTTYKPEVIWSDGDWEASDTYWKSTEFLAWLYNDSPVKETVVTNDRWGNGTTCKHGGYLTCSDHFRPGKLQTRKWENCLTLDKRSWGYRRNAAFNDYLTPEELITELVQTIAFGGNFLINIGPTKEGTLPTMMEERLLQMGQWLQINGDAIYASKPWTTAQKDNVTNNVYYTSNKQSDILFAIFVGSIQREFILGSVEFANVEKIQILGGRPGTIQWKKRNGGGIIIRIPSFEVITSKWAFTFAITLKD